MRRRPPKSTRPATLFPYTTLCRARGAEGRRRTRGRVQLEGPCRLGGGALRSPRPIGAAMSALDAVDGLAAGRALGASGLLATLNAADVLDASDVHVALRAGALTGEADQELLLALAMVVRALRSGSTCLDLKTLPDELAGHVVPADLANRLAASPLAAGPAILHVEGEIGRHTSELQSLMRLSYAVFCLTKKKERKNTSQKT